MIGEVHRALAALLTPLLPAGCPLHVGAPGQPGLTLTIGGVREDVKSGDTDWEDIRDGTGRVTARRPPTRRFDLLYHVSAVHDDIGPLLDAVLIAADPGRRLDPALLSPDFAGKPVFLRLADEPGAAYAIGLVVNAPLVLPLVTDIATAPDQVALDVARPGRASRPAPTHPAPARPRRSIVEDDDAVRGQAQ